MNNLHKLKQLYEISQLENLRGNGVCPSVGNSRELDLIAYFMHIYGKENVKLPPRREEVSDVILFGVPFSIKHKSNMGNSGIKHIWTSENESVKKFFNNFKKFKVGLIIVLFGPKTTIIRFVTTDILNSVFSDMKEVFKVPRGNSRGVEYSAKFIKEVFTHVDKIDLNFILNKRPTIKNALDTRLKFLSQDNNI